MKEPPDLRELVGDDLHGEELEALRRVDALLRAVPAPPHELPVSLTRAVAEVPHRERPRERRRLALVLAFAAVLAATAFALGRWTGGTGFESAWTAELQATAAAQDASASVEVGEADEDSGNRELVVTVSGLPPLREGELYALWLERDGEWEATCGYFSVGEGETTVRMTVSYDFAEFDAWVLSRGSRDEHVRLFERAIRG